MVRSRVVREDAAVAQRARAVLHATGESRDHFSVRDQLGHARFRIIHPHVGHAARGELRLDLGIGESRAVVDVPRLVAVIWLAETAVEMEQGGPGADAAVAHVLMNVEELHAGDLGHHLVHADVREHSSRHEHVGARVASQEMTDVLDRHLFEDALGGGGQVLRVAGPIEGGVQEIVEVGDVRDRRGPVVPDPPDGRDLGPDGGARRRVVGELLSRGVETEEAFQLRVVPVGVAVRGETRDLAFVAEALVAQESGDFGIEAARRDEIRRRREPPQAAVLECARRRAQTVSGAVDGDDESVPLARQVGGAGGVTQVVLVADQGGMSQPGLVEHFLLPRQSEELGGPRDLAWRFAPPGEAQVAGQEIEVDPRLRTHPRPVEVIVGPDRLEVAIEEERVVVGRVREDQALRGQRDGAHFILLDARDAKGFLDAPERKSHVQLDAGESLLSHGGGDAALLADDGDRRVVGAVHPHDVAGLRGHRAAPIVSR